MAPPLTYQSIEGDILNRTALNKIFPVTSHYARSRRVHQSTRLKVFSGVGDNEPHASYIADAINQFESRGLQCSVRIITKIHPTDDNIYLALVSSHAAHVKFPLPDYYLVVSVAEMIALIIVAEMECFAYQACGLNMTGVRFPLRANAFQAQYNQYPELQAAFNDLATRTTRPGSLPVLIAVPGTYLYAILSDLHIARRYNDTRGLDDDESHPASSSKATSVGSIDGENWAMQSADSIPMRRRIDEMHLERRLVDLNEVEMSDAEARTPVPSVPPSTRASVPPSAPHSAPPTPARSIKKADHEENKEVKPKHKLEAEKEGEEDTGNDSGYASDHTVRQSGSKRVKEETNSSKVTTIKKEVELPGNTTMAVTFSVQVNLRRSARLAEKNGDRKGKAKAKAEEPDVEVSIEDVQVECKAGGSGRRDKGKGKAKVPEEDAEGVEDDDQQLYK